MATLTFKVTSEQARAVRRAARLRKMTLSDYLRRVALPEQAPMKSQPVEKLRAGRVVIEPAPDAPKITSEMIAAALYD